MAPTHDHNAIELVGGQRFNRVLTEGGGADLVKAFATHTDYPSWYNGKMEQRPFENS